MGTASQRGTAGVVGGVLAAISVAHLLNDMMQSLVVSVYPLLKEAHRLSFAQIGLITMAYSVTASVLQPLVGWSTDRQARPYSLVFGMVATLLGLLLLAVAGGMWSLLGGSVLIGLGSSVFHPEASRLARLVSGGRHGLAQSIFQVGGNLGSSLGPIAAVLVVMPRGQTAIAWSALAALLAMALLLPACRWYAAHQRATAAHAAPPPPTGLSRGRIALALGVLGVLIFSKYFYLASLTNFYTFYLIGRFQVDVHTAQVLLFVFLFAVAAGTILGGPVGDRIGRRRVIWISILGVAPFTLALPHAGLWATVALSVVIGLILASAFSAILVYAQILLPGRVGLVGGLFFGFAFGMAGIGAAVLGHLADHLGLAAVYGLCSFLPLLGLLTVLLPDLEGRRQDAAEG